MARGLWENMMITKHNEILNLTFILPLGERGCEACKHTRLFCSRCVKKIMEAQESGEWDFPVTTEGKHESELHI